MASCRQQLGPETQLIKQTQINVIKAIDYSDAINFERSQNKKKTSYNYNLFFLENNFLSLHSTIYKI